MLAHRAETDLLNLLAVLVEPYPDHVFQRGLQVVLRIDRLSRHLFYFSPVRLQDPGVGQERNEMEMLFERVRLVCMFGAVVSERETLLTSFMKASSL